MQECDNAAKGEYCKKCIHVVLNHLHIFTALETIYLSMKGDKIV